MKRFLAAFALLLFVIPANACPIVRSSCLQSFSIQEVRTAPVVFQEVRSAPVVFQEVRSVPICFQSFSVPVIFESFALQQQRIVQRERRFDFNLSLQLQQRSRQVQREKVVIRSRH